LSSAAAFAYHDVGARCLQVLLDQGIDVRLVVTHRDDPAERVWFASVEQLARARGLQVLLDPPADELERRVRAAAPDFIFSFYYRRMLPPAILARAARGAYNMHGSLLPRHRGRAPVNWAVLLGDTETGATLHEMVDKPDAGRIVDQQAVPIGPDDTALDVFRRVTDAAETVLRRSLPRLVAGTAQLRAQDLAQGSYHGGRRPEDGRIDWSRSAAEIHNLVRAVAPPYPGAFSEAHGRRLRVLRTRLEPARRARGGPPGPYCEGGKWFADCGDGRVLALLEVDPPA
jgi:methionyl-tRNA formyltransferase